MRGEGDGSERSVVVPSFVQRMADGGWRMADGGWRMADGGWRMATMPLLSASGLGRMWKNVFFREKIERFRKNNAK